MPLHVSSTCAHHQEVKIVVHSLWYHHTYRWTSRVKDDRLVCRSICSCIPGAVYQTPSIGLYHRPFVVYNSLLFDDFTQNCEHSSCIFFSLYCILIFNILLRINHHSESCCQQLWCYFSCCCETAVCLLFYHTVSVFPLTLQLFKALQFEEDFTFTEDLKKNTTLQFVNFLC